MGYTLPDEPGQCEKQLALQLFFLESQLLLVRLDPVERRGRLCYRSAFVLVVAAISFLLAQGSGRGGRGRTHVLQVVVVRPLNMCPWEDGAGTGRRGGSELHEQDSIYTMRMCCRKSIVPRVKRESKVQADMQKLL